MSDTSSTALFTHKAELVSTIVHPAKRLDDALAYALSACVEKEACPMLISGCEAELSPPAEALCETKRGKIIAAPDLDATLREGFAEQCDQAGIRLIHEGLRDHLGGIDIGITWANWGIAETGTLVIDSTREEIRLASMISEIHVVLLPVDRIVGGADEIADALETAMRDPYNYTAFITGASRTADIERVLALGVHGPLELHVLLLGDD
ncbi:MAG: lactate utilization protein [Desulfosarcinaceae bacterium]|nr:lactate utilization protein [Desulfosarcinaceae bacterium]